MKYLLLTVFLIACCDKIFAQSSTVKNPDTTKTNKTLRAYNDTSWTINVLTAPSSPGADLGVNSPPSIQKPTHMSWFTTSLLNATNNFTTIPSSYAVDFTPAWLFGG